MNALASNQAERIAKTIPLCPSCGGTSHLPVLVPESNKLQQGHNVNDLVAAYGGALLAPQSIHQPLPLLKNHIRPRFIVFATTATGDIEEGVAEGYFEFVAETLEKVVVEGGERDVAAKDGKIWGENGQ